MSIAHPNYADNAARCQVFRDAHPGPQHHFARCEHAVQVHFGAVPAAEPLALFEEAPRAKARRRKSS